MPLEFLLVLVVGGVSLIVVAVQYSGISRPFRLGSEAEAREAFVLRNEDERPAACILSRDGRAAFLKLDNGRTGVISAMGSKYVTRVFGPEDIRSVACDGNGGMVVRYRDFTYPFGRYRMADAESALEVAEWLGVESNAADTS